MKTIPLTMGKFAIVDDDDYERLKHFKWFAQPHRKMFYAVRNHRENGKRNHVRMHREVLHLKVGDPSVDHKNWDSLDNRKENLRFATNSQNQANKVRNRTTEGGFKGVFRDPRCTTKPWGSHIRFQNKLLHLGMYSTPKEAGMAYNAKAAELFGEFAVLNPV